MTSAQRALFDAHLPYAQKLARIYTRSAPAWADEYEAAAIRALAESAESWVEGTKGANGRLATFKTYAIKRLKQRLNDVTRFARRKKRKPDGLQVELDDQLATEAIRQRSDPSTHIILQEVLDQIEDDRQREALRLHFLEGFSLKEIANKFDLSRQRIAQIIAETLAVLRVRVALSEYSCVNAEEKPLSLPALRGFGCPKCRTATRIHTSIKPSSNLIIRYRLCPACDYRVTTEERIRRRGKKENSY